jgi:tRNA pseudouridine synthase 9
MSIKKATKAAARAAGAQRPTFTAGGARYCAPYKFWWHSAFPAGIKNVTLAKALTDFFKFADDHIHFQTPTASAACHNGLVQVRRQQRDEAFTTVTSSSMLVSEGDRFLVRVHVHEPPVVAELPRVLLETDCFVVVDKPAGLPTTGVCTGASLCIEGQAVADGAGGALYAAHRLDKPVSGVQILARSTRIQNRVMNVIGRGDDASSKSYIARVRPSARPLTAAATCDAPLLKPQRHAGGAAVACRVRGKSASTRFVPLTPPMSDGTQLVECTPTQGRTHQIRAHLGLLGLPIANDVLYGGTADSPVGVSSTADEPVLASALRAAEEGWCPLCEHTAREAVAGRAVQLPMAASGIWLHALRYRIPSFDLDVEAPLPLWALTC